MSRNIMHLSCSGYKSLREILATALSNSSGARVEHGISPRKRGKRGRQSSPPRGGYFDRTNPIYRLGI